MKRHAGETLMTCAPYAHVTTKDQHEIICHFCFTLCSNLKTCSSCKFAKYCKRSCQRADWLIHKYECQCLCQVAPRIPTESVRLFLRIFIRHKLNQHDKAFENDPGLRTFIDMQSHIDLISKDKKRLTQMADMCYTVRSLVGELWQLPPVATIMNYFGKMVINSFTIHCTSSMNALGTGVYVSASLLDHSCLPNCIVVFNGTQLILRTICSFSNDSIENLRISYIDELVFTQERRTQLEESYYFTCSCIKCTCDPSADSRMLQIRCQGDTECTGQLCMLSNGQSYSKCSQCSTLPSDPDLIKHVYSRYEEIKTNIKKIKEMKDSQGDLQEAFDLCNKTIDKNKRILPPENIHMTRLYDETFDIAIKLENWMGSVECGVRCCDGFKFNYPLYHPTLTLQFMKLIKVISNIPEMDGHNYFKGLRDEIKLHCQITFGQDHPVTTEFIALLRQDERTQAIT